MNTNGRHSEWPDERVELTPMGQMVGRMTEVLVQSLGEGYRAQVFDSVVEGAIESLAARLQDSIMPEQHSEA